MPSSIRFYGGQELLRELDGLAENLRRKYIRQAAAAGGRTIINAAKSNLRARGTRGKRINKRTGKRIKGLAMSMRLRPTSQWPSRAQLARKGIIGTSVGFEWPVGAHAHLVEFGHRMVTSHKAGHREVGFVQPRPFFRPAIESTKAAVYNTFHAKLQAGLVKEAERIRAKFKSRVG